MCDAREFSDKHSAHAARSPDQLMVQDDPAFLPDLALPGLDIDLSALDIKTDESSRLSSILSPHSQRSSLSSGNEADTSMLPLVIPSSAHGGSGGRGGFELPSGLSGSVRGSAGFGRIVDEEEDFNIDLGFHVDDHGNVIETPVRSEQADQLDNLRVRGTSAIGATMRENVAGAMQERGIEVSERMM